MKNVLVLLALLAICKPSLAHPGSAAAESLKKHAPLSFLENKGQVTDQFHNPRTDIQFSVKAAAGLTIFIGKGAIHYQFSKSQQITQSVNPGDFSQSLSADKFNTSPQNFAFQGGIDDNIANEMYRMDVQLVGANRNAEVISEEKQNYHENYFTAYTCANGGVIACAYSRIVYKDIYPHIDWILYTKEGKLKHEFVVNEGGKVSDIKLQYGGATDLQLTPGGCLLAGTPLGSIVEDVPVSYQGNGKLVKSSFHLTGSILTYNIEQYSGKLTIDPALQWGTYYGGTGEELAYEITNDVSGNVYMAGYTNSPAAIVTSGANQTIFGGGLYDAFLAKFSSEGNLLWATYYGGAGEDIAFGVVSDAGSNAYISGYTASTSGIATPGAYHSTNSGGDDAFLAKFDSTGAIVWATYYGGGGTEYGRKLAINGLGQLYLTGNTSSPTGIATTGAYQTTIGGGGTDCFLAKFTGDGSLLWATYYGGNGQDWGNAVTTEAAGNIYITGYTAGSTTGIATSGAYQSVYGGGLADAFLAKFSAAGALLWATYLGGSGEEGGNGVHVDTSGNIFLAGYTASADGIATASAHQTTYGGGTYDGFLTKFTSSGSIIWSTYYGGSGNDVVNCVTTDVHGNAYICGSTASLTGITTTDAYYEYFSGGFTAFLSEFSDSGEIMYGTYYAETSGGSAATIVLDTASDIYLSGFTTASAGIATPGAYQATHAGGYDVLLVKFKFCQSPSAGAILGASTICVGSSITVSDSVAGGVWSSVNGHATVNSAGIVTGVSAGVETIKYLVENSCSADSTSTIITVTPHPAVAAITGVDTLCIGTSAFLSDATAGGTWMATNTIASISSAGYITASTAAGLDTVLYIVTGTCGIDTVTRIIHISNCVATEEQMLHAGLGMISVHPNPTRNNLTITSAELIRSVGISNVFGQKMFSENYDDKEVTIDVAQFPAGIYFIKVNNRNVCKFIKE